MNTRARSAAWTSLALAVTVVYLLPVYWMINTSFKSAGEVFATPPQLLAIPPVITSYTEAAFANAGVLTGLVNSAIIAVGTTTVTLIVAVPAAFALARLRIRYVEPVLVLFLVVQMIPAINLALPLFSIFSRVGLVNTYAGLIIANCSLAIPLAIIILRPYFLSIPEDILEAARVDGCTVFGAFIRVAVPVSVPGIITTVMITLLGAWGEYVFGLSLATDESMQPITVILAGVTSAFGTRWNDVMAVSVVVALPIIVAFVVFQKYVIAGMLEGGTKE